MEPARRRDVAVLELLVVALLGGVAVGTFVAAFIWLYETGIEALWSDLPDAVGVDPFESWWIFAVPVVGGLLVGLGHRFLGNDPEPIEQVLDTVRAGGRIEPEVAPKTFVNSALALSFGGPIGFEAALLGVIGGGSFWVGDRLHSVQRLVASAAGVDDIEDLPASMRRLPVWTATIVGLFVYRWLPFGQLDSDFRFGTFDGHVGVVDGLWIVGFAAVVCIPVAWALSVVTRVEHVTPFDRAPELFGIAGGLGFAALAWIDPFVLFSGQQVFQDLDQQGTGELLYLAVANWVALLIALATGWRGGPIFPSYLSVAAIAVVAAGVIGLPSDLLVVGGVAAVSAVFLKGKVPAAFVLSLYVAPLSYAAVVVLGAIGAALALAAGSALGAVPRPTGEDVGPAAA